jgi:hypothetical protein
MSPRHFSKVLSNPVYSKELQDQVDQAPNLWYAFTAITGIAKLFSYTPEVINNNPVKDSQSGTDKIS